MKFIRYIIFEDLQINIGSKSDPTLFFDILYYTKKFYEDMYTSFRLDIVYVPKLNIFNEELVKIWRTKYTSIL